MHRITEMPAWERLFKRIVWAQMLGYLRMRKMFLSGLSII